VNDGRYWDRTSGPCRVKVAGRARSFPTSPTQFQAVRVTAIGRIPRSSALARTAKSMDRTVDSAVPTVSTGGSFSLGIQRIASDEFINRLLNGWR
jgi:hypothetical protein